MAAFALSPPTMASEPLTSTAPTDDVSASTTMAENRFLTSHDKVKEYVVKFLFRPNTSSHNTEVAQTHYNILCCITHLYPEAQVFDNFGKTMKEFPLLKTFDAYLRHFKLQFVKANPNKKRNAVYLSFHRIRSSVSISEIRKNSEVAALLSKQNTRLTVHLWKEDETQIANLGFNVKVDSSNVTKEYFEERVCTKISESTHRDKKKIPQFHCRISSPFVIEEGGTRTSTKAYDLQCKQSDAKELITLLQETYKTDPQFMFHQIRHRDMNAYKMQFANKTRSLLKAESFPLKESLWKLCFMYPTKFHKSLACSTLFHIKTLLLPSQPLTANSFISTPLPKDQPDNVFRSLCGNPNGFTIGPCGGDFIDYCKEVCQFQADTSCLYEHNLDSHNHKVRNILKKQLSTPSTIRN